MPSHTCAFLSSPHLPAFPSSLQRNIVLKQFRGIPLADLETKLAGAVKNKATPLILVCASGMRSKRAVATATKLGFERAQSLAGGMRAWREAGLPVEKA